MVAKGADHAQMAALLERFDTASGVGAVFSVGGLAVLIGTVMLTIGLIRSGVVPAWVAIALTGAVIVNIMGFTASSNGVVAASWALLLVAMGCFARASLGGGQARVRALHAHPVAR